RSEAYFVFPLAQGTPGKQCGLAATGVYQPSLRSPWLAADETRQYRLTVSLGCAGVVPGPGHTRDELFNMADKALYQAKAAGRNQMSCGWPDELLSAGNAG
uniref:GGDEF domain-containing protein n=1 Tax=Thiolapillus sp. TaxID=2017437 RepID=UPI003AF5B498